MKKIIKKPFEILIENWKIALAIAILLVALKLLFDELCMFKIVFGIPCPSCGMTRAYKNLLMLNFKDAFYYHPLFWLVPIVAILLIYKDFKYIHKIYSCKILWIVIIAVIMITYIVRFIVLYPEAPMDINKNSFLFRIIKLVKKTF
ncbi:MAG: DUF2752 domain-containing protein [Acholeplasmatales bacterium]|nr:DUF2752 domain-containing protein [Acholeplasmatales bacterium]